ncbi:MAG: aldehyde dehydrogenase family protein [Chlorobi bacterium]|nr:aldehyde dehydrogenase family protein [Chlorobiota bacterium]
MTPLDIPFQVRNLIAGKRTDSEVRLPITDKYTGEILAEAPLATEAQVEEAVSAAVRAFDTFRRSSAEKRADILRALRDGIARRADDFTRLIVKEAGKPLSYARNEVRRALDNLDSGIRAVLEFAGEQVPMDYLNGKGKTAYTVRVPYGPVLGISPFNFPLNLALHKIIPAVGSGSPIILKPAPQTPLSMFLLADILEEAGVPAGTVQIVLTGNKSAEQMVRDDRLKILSFTGSDRVGWYLKSIAGRKKVFLEMGGNAAALIDSDAPLERAAKKLAYGAFLYAGQICISTQRIYVLKDVFDRFTDLFLEETARIPTGDPSLPETVNGPMISRKDLYRIRDWVEEAREGGARILAGGNIVDETHDLFAPTVLTGTRPGMKVVDEEAFAPVVIIEPVESVEEGIRAVNASRYGLQASVYSDSLKTVRRFIREVDAGGIMVNEIPGFRIDSMPYGGMKDSGLGREGPRYALREYTQPKLVVIQD